MLSRRYRDCYYYYRYYQKKVANLEKYLLPRSLSNFIRDMAYIDSKRIIYLLKVNLTQCCTAVRDREGHRSVVYND